MEHPSFSTYIQTYDELSLFQSLLNYIFFNIYYNKFNNFSSKSRIDAMRERIKQQPRDNFFVMICV